MQLIHFEWKVRVIHEDIDRPESLLGRFDHALDLIFLRYVRLVDHAASTRAFDFLKYFLRRLFVLMIIDDDRGAALSQPLRGRCADAPASAGDERDFSTERPGRDWGHGRAIED
jgi:hypothetical protein